MIKIGLDMYLRVKHFIWGDDSDKQKEGLKKLFPVFESLEPNEIKFELGYWRKANQIHKWFVDNVQDGTDDCGNYPVSPEKLEELRDLCLKAIEQHEKNDPENDGSDILPPTEGFFFGGTEIDDYYWEDLKHTVEIINKIDFDVKDPAKKLVNKIQGAKIPADECEFEYHSSW